MGNPVDMSALQNVIADYSFAYLITIAHGDRIHTSVVHPSVDGENLIVTAPSDRVQKNAGQQPKVSLVWPPREPGGYSLIVDGLAKCEDETLTLAPSRAIQHRPETLASPDAAGCVADCIEF